MTLLAITASVIRQEVDTQTANKCEGPLGYLQIQNATQTSNLPATNCLCYTGEYGHTHKVMDGGLISTDPGQTENGWPTDAKS